MDPIQGPQQNKAKQIRVHSACNIVDYCRAKRIAAGCKLYTSKDFSELKIIYRSPRHLLTWDCKVEMILPRGNNTETTALVTYIS